MEPHHLLENFINPLELEARLRDDYYTCVNNLEQAGKLELTAAILLARSSAPHSKLTSSRYNQLWVPQILNYYSMRSKYQLCEILHKWTKIAAGISTKNMFDDFDITLSKYLKWTPSKT